MLGEAQKYYNIFLKSVYSLIIGISIDEMLGNNHSDS